MSAHSGNTEVTASANSLLGYEVPQEVLQNALRKELENPNETESEGYLEEEEEESTANPTPKGSQTVTPGAPPETRANATVENFLSNPSYHYDLYVESRERMVTPQHLVEVDEVVYGSKGLDWDDQHATIEDQAEDYIYKLDINRNHLVPIHTTVNTRRDLTDLDDINYSELLRKPTHFHVLGKPGVGATTFARKFADKMNLVYISPVSAIEYFTGKKNEVPTQPDINIPRETPPTASLALLASIGIDDSQVFEFLKKRMEELDVKHRGYILDGWPILRSEEIPVADQLEMLRQLPQPPDILFIMQMQNRDLFKRRVDQKMDPLTSIIYTKKQFIRPMQIPRELPATSHQDISNIQSRSKVSLATGMTMSVTTISSTGLHDRDKTEDQRMRMEEEDEDFLPLQPAVVGRLISRLEDHPVQVHKDFENWKIAVTPLQQYINSLDRTKIFELDVYHSPKIVVENAVRIMSAIGILPSPVPVEISHPLNKMAKRVRPEDELEGYSSGEEEEGGTDTPGCVPEDEGIKDNIDWAPILRAIVLIARIDPRFRWRISRWKNLCPVGLKEGRSVAGNPQRAYGLFDKVYFLSTEDAVQKFSFNPRRYLIKDMPTSPVKFFVVGHPLAGKTLFAHELASLSGGYVIDMRRQTRKCLEAVKQRFLFKTRFEATMQAKKDINKRNYEAWKRQERFRRQRIHKWIDDYNKRRAAEEINAALAIEREDRMKEYRKLRWKSEFHELSAPFKASPCVAEPLAFSWKKFVEDIKRGVEAWTHQERLELAWELFKEGRLRYKMKGGKGPKFRRVYRGSSAAEGYGLEEESGGGSDGEQVGEGGSDEGAGEGEEVGEEEDRRRKRRKRRKKRKKIKCKKPAEEITVVTEDEQDSSPFSSDDEADESLRLRYPDMCSELTEPIPRPGEVEDQNEQVQAYVREKVAETEKWVNTIPGEVYEEILGIGIQEAERKYREAHPDAHETGGWIVENLAEDVEKWRGILRNTKLCPDQVFVLQDTSTDYSRISNRLKRLFLNSVAEGKVKLQSIAHVGRRSRKRQTMEYWAGGEEIYPPPEYEDHFGRDYLGAEDQSVTTDNLVGHLCATPSELMQIMMDQRRQRSRIASNDSKDSVTNYDELGKVVDVVDKKDIDVSISLATSKTFKVTPPTPTTTTTAESEAAAVCKPLWRTAVSLREMGKIPDHKPAIYEMKVILPMSEAERRVGSGGWYEYEGESASLLDTQKNMMTIMEETEEMMGEQEEMSLDGLRSTEYAGEGEGENEDIGDRKSETSHIPTPSGLNTPVDELSRLDCDPEDETCLPPDQPLSLKKSFLKQVSGFDDFWNMVFPVVSAQKVGVFMVGIVDEMTAKNIAQKFWDDLQDRFALPPIPVTLADLEEDDADVRESRALWTGKKDEPKMMPEGSDFDEDEEEDERSDGEKSEGEMTGLYSSRLKGLEGNPDSYRATLQSIEENQLFGDFKHYCPVTLADHKLLRKGSARYAVRYQDRLYYLANHDAYVRFMAEPKQFLPPPDKKCIPAPRICITGSPGCDQRGIALELSERAGIYFVDFRERLQDIVKGRLGKDVGPFHTGEIVTRAESPSESENEEDDRKGGEDGGEDEEDDIFDADTEWIKEKRERKQMEKLALQSLAIADKADVETFPINSLERTEAKANKVAPVGQLNQKERCIKNFLETGAQLPPEVLDDFIPQLWTEEPFISTGFILAGFPNTAKDVQYLIDRDCIPEYVYIMECKKKTCRNRLIREAMARWHRRDQLEANANMAERIRAKMRDRRGRGDMLDENKEVKVSIWCNNEKACVKAAKALYHYYYIFSKKISQMKAELNQRRVDWVSVPTDRSLFEAKAKLRKLLTPALKYRRNFLEATHVLYPEEAESLVKRHYFHLSKFSRWCPVEVFKGNQGINLWNASGITKYPVLYRNYIYFIAGEDNLEDFRSQVLDIVEHAPPLPTVPVSVVIIGPPKSGKTDLCRRISKKLGLLYINEAEVIGNILRHAIAIELDMDDAPVFQGPQPMIFAQKVYIYLKKGHSVPQFMFYRALDYALMHPLAQHHGVVFDGYPMDDLSVQEMVDRGIVPASVIQLDVDIQTVLQRCEKERRVPNYNYEFLLQDCDDLMRAQYEYFGPMSSPCLLWYGHKMQNLVYLDGTKNPAVVFEEARSEIMKSQGQRQQAILKLINSKGKISRKQSKFRPKSVPKVPTNSAFSAATPPPQQLVF